MNIAIFANETIFPVLLLCVFCYFLIIRPETQAFKLETAGVSIPTETDTLSDIYEMIIQNSFWQSELDSISDRKELIDKLIAIADNNGYCLTDRDVENSIQQHTQSSQSNYICLPIGCWRVG